MGSPVPLVGQPDRRVTDAEVLVIGGGPAGTAAAIGLAAAGRRVLLLERDAVAREKVCGEFLGPGAAASLTQLGLAPAALDGVRLRRARVAHGNAAAVFALPFDGWGVRRQRLDAALLQATAAAGGGIASGAAVRSATYEGKNWHVRLGDGATLTAPILVLATGKHELRGHPRAAIGDAIGLKLHLRLAAQIEDTVLLPTGQGYAGLQPTGGGLANLCMTVRGPPPADMVAQVAGCSALGTRLLAGAVPLWNRPLAVAGIPYGFLHRGSAAGPPNLYRIGDQFAVVPSFCGEGMGMALAGGREASRAIISGESADAFHRRWRRALAGPMRWAGTINWLLGAAPGLVIRGGALPGAGRLVARRTRAC